MLCVSTKKLTVEEVALAGAVATDHHIVTLVEWVDDRLFAVAFKALDDNLERLMPIVNNVPTSK